MLPLRANFGRLMSFDSRKVEEQVGYSVDMGFGCLRQWTDKLKIRFIIIAIIEQLSCLR